MDAKSIVKTFLGGAAEYLIPSAVRDLEHGQNPDRFPKIKKLILFSRMQRAKRSGDYLKGEGALHQFWQTDFAHEFYGRFQQRFEKWFNGAHAPAIQTIVQYASRHDIARVVEIGCGDGRALDHISQQLADVPQFVGLDINPRIIEENGQRFAANPRLEFVSGNAFDWISDNLAPATLLYSYGGVLEYFSKESLEDFFGLIAGQDGNAIALVEPVDPQHDLIHDHDSHQFGEENSFSHNYKYLLEKSGFTLVFTDEVFTGEIRWVMMLASRDG